MVHIISKLSPHLVHPVFSWTHVRMDVKDDNLENLAGMEVLLPYYIAANANNYERSFCWDPNYGQICIA